MQKRRNKTTAFSLLSLFAGALLTLAFAPFNFEIDGILMPAILCFIWLYATPRQAAWYGLLFGIGFFATSCYWVYISIHQFGGASLPAAIGISVVFVLLMAVLFFALQGYVLGWLKRYFPDGFAGNALFCLVLFPLSWLVFELFRSVFPFGGFPWNLLGYSQLYSWLAGYAPLFTVYGLSFLCAITAGALVLFALQKHKIFLFYMVIIFILVWLLGAYLKSSHTKSHLTSHVSPLTVSLIQGNIPQSVKWHPGTAQHAMQLYLKLTKQHLNSQLIVWPEAALTYYPQQIEPYLTQLDQLAKAHHTTIILGIPMYHNGKYYNALLTLGDGHGIYLKRHLVPFGEYYPMQWLMKPVLSALNIPMSDLSPGPEVQKNLRFLVKTSEGQKAGTSKDTRTPGRSDVQTLKVAPSICYEIIYPLLTAEQARGANLLLTVSDDSWFGNSIARYQHLAMAQMRSLELGKPQLFVSNSGITAVINAQGRITAALKPNRIGVLTRAL